MLDDVTKSVVDTINTSLRNPTFFDLVGTPNYFASVIDVNGHYFASTTDGVGSKIDHIIKHNVSCDIIGIDCFAMNINDLLCVGGNPVAFQNHITTQRVTPVIIPDIIEGMVNCCNDNFVILSGGETEVLKETKFHISGSMYGFIADGAESMIDGSKVTNGDIIIGLESNGLHANGWTALDEKTNFINEDIILPTKIYARDIHTLLTRTRPSAIINITGGGFRNLERIPRSFVYDIKHEITQQIFADIKTKFTHEESYSMFNMGIGMMVIVKPNDVENALDCLKDAKIIGEVKRSEDVSNDLIGKPCVIVNGVPLS